ncbi:cation-translocating P-type ATPase [Bacillus sp. EB106-08-02-XG196]|uniref:cation-translocating P-type ATPase n=1 Tax=Bacillus sp. EB106-08-02-XG196 TaxID=2737049 RepID=UPI0015C47440|nr:cation-translocating P-type ATPase [Bacillus sp. EB106-08-02-XG196]NWQ44349.1 cation-translocating P-type ATPase [Bacillus sp. EB106-08-02-XG196]
MWFTKSSDAVVAELVTDPSTGLSTEEANKRLEKIGPNAFNESKKPSMIMLFFEQIKSPLIYILIVAAIISIVVGEYSDSVIIVLVILLNGVIGVIQEANAEKALDELKKMTTPKAIVKRDGNLKEIPSEQLVPGDIVLIDAGRFIPADLRLIETANLKIEESSLTGESVPVDKDASWRSEVEIPIADQHNMAFMSTLSTYGRGLGVVVHTGMKTEIGKIAGLLGNQKRELTPLQIKLAELSKILGIGAILISAVLFLIGFFQGRDLLDMFLIAVSLAVAAIPEGLPAIVTIVLALGVQRMIKRRAVVRKLPAVETLGAVSVICSDKTGTLTQNKMTVTKVYVNGLYVPLSHFSVKDPHEKLFLEAMALCNDAVVTDEEQTGDPTEIALVAAAKQLGFEKQHLDMAYQRVFEIPFDSERKMMTTVHKHNERYLVMVKGALESILPLTSHIVFAGNKNPFTIKENEQINAKVNAMSGEALRVLAIAYKEIISLDDLIPEKLESNLILLGLTGMIDPPREEVKKSIEQCKNAGIRTVMITGDHKQTAFAIAKELGIALDEKESMSGPELNALSEHEFKNIVKNISVFARVSPEHKVKIVKALKANGEIASMTGDGVNDAPSLQQADVGVAMGLSGTDVAKGAADIVLTDDNFSTIVAAVEEGRNIYQNIKKSILFLLSCNLGEIVTLFIAILLGWPAPLTAVHILWVNLITDTLPAISLGLDPDDPDVMKEKPRSIKESIFAHGSGTFTVTNGLLIGIITLFAFIAGLMIYTKADSIFTIDFAHVPKDALMHAQTMAFITLSISQLFHSLNLRNNHKSIFQVGLFTNKYLVGSILLGIFIQVALVNIPVFNEIFEINVLTLKDWLFILTLSLLPVIFNELYKAGKRIFFPSSEDFQSNKTTNY